MKKENLTKLFREGIMAIVDSGIVIKDKVTSCYTLEKDEETYIVVNFSTGHIMVSIENVKEVDTSDILFNPYEWQYDLLNYEGKPVCSIIKLKED